MKISTISLLFWAIFLQNVVAQTPQPVAESPQWSSGELSEIQFSTLFNPAKVNEAGTLLADAGETRIKKSALTIEFFHNPTSLVAFNKKYSATVELTVFFKTNDAISAIPTQKRVVLLLEYDPATGVQDRRKDIFVVENCVWAKITVEKMTTDLSETLLAETDVFYLKSSILAEQYRRPKEVAPSGLTLRQSSNGGYLQVSWSPQEWAVAYDLEWAFVENQAARSSQIRWNFDENAARIRTNTPFFEIPLVFEAGILAVRVRGVGRWGAHLDVAVPGNWSHSARGAQSILGSGGLGNTMQITPEMRHEHGRKNWQFTAIFAENGRQKNTVSYMDGSLRSRQAVSHFNENGQHLLVGESIYDHHGRSAIQVMTTPVNPTLEPEIGDFGSLEQYETTRPKIGFQPNFNQNEAGSAYNRANFDLDGQVSAERMATNSGASQYYSSSNSTGGKYRDFIPDAQGFPFLQTEFMPDATGRIKRQSNVGGAHQIGSGHEQRFFYSSPSQSELDRWFGNDVGHAHFYKKQLISDENGQLFVSLTNPRGAVVASGLVGGSPENVDALPESLTATPIRLDLSAENNMLRLEDGLLLATRSLVIAQNRTPVSVNYAFEPGRFNVSACGENFCFSCVYDLLLEVRNEAGNVIFHVRRKIGNWQNLQNCDAQNFAKDTTFLADQGTLFITKTLTINRLAATEAIEILLEKSDACFRNPIENAIPAPTCEPPTDDCIPCQFEQKMAIIQGHEITYFQRKEGNNSACRLACADGETTLPDALIYQNLLGDLRPGGQYAEVRDTHTNALAAGQKRLSIFNTNRLDNARIFSNGLSFSADRLGEHHGLNWKNPLFFYQNLDGSRAEIDVTDWNPSIDYLLSAAFERDGRRFVLPQNILSDSLALAVWQPNWSESLVAYHPEYAYFEWIINNKNSYDRDNLMFADTSYAAAKDHDFLNFTATNAPISSTFLQNDAYFAENPSDLARMRDSLNQVFRIGGVAKNVFDLMRLTLFCSSPFYDSRPAELSACLADDAHNLDEMTDERAQNRAWVIFRSVYLSKKNTILDEARAANLLSKNRLQNNCIGTWICPVCSMVESPIKLAFSQKTRRFQREKCYTTGDFPIDENHDGVEDSLPEITRQEAARARRECGVCPAMRDFQTFLNGLAAENTLTEPREIPGLLPISLTNNLTEFWPIQASNYLYSPVISNNNLDFQINLMTGQPCANLILTKNRIDVLWKNIRFFTCINMEGGIITLEAIDYRDSMTVISVTDKAGFLTQNCEVPTLSEWTPEAGWVARVVRFVLSQPDFSTNIIEPRPLPRIFLNRNLWPMGTDIRWKSKSPLPTIAGGTLIGQFFILENEINKVTDKTKTCGVEILFPKGLTAAQIVRVGDFHPGSGDVTRFLVDVFNEKGQKFTLDGKTCQPFYFKTPPASGKVCCLPIFPRVPNSNDCQRDLNRLTEANRSRAWDARRAFLRDSLRREYVAQCLRAVENLVVNYAEPFYAATLFYRDQAGNLIKTVPPKAVLALNPTQIAQSAAHRNGTAPPIFAAHDENLTTDYRQNSLGEIFQKNSPDGGETRVCYDELGRTIMSQDAAQRTENRASYIFYDELGRASEGGTCRFSGAIFPKKIQYQADFITGTFRPIEKREITRSIFDASAASISVRLLFAEGAPKRLRNRVASLTFDENGDHTAEYSTHFSYDISGNVAEMVQDFAALPQLLPVAASAAAYQHATKLIRYEYNLVSGHVNRQIYQPGKSDQFIHFYEYDADNRLISTKTSPTEWETSDVREMDAAYEYYVHGPTARVEIGRERVQGLDFVYRLNGQLKSMNSPLASAEADPGRDGFGESAVPSDAFGLAFGFYENDYQSIGMSSFLPNEVSSSALNAQSSPVFNGLPRLIFSRNNSLLETPTMAEAIRYDQLGRLKEVKILAAPPVGLGFFATENWRETFNYDLNGNFQTVRRKGQTGSLLDDLTYFYQSNNNQLTHLTDPSGASSGEDLATQTPNFYQYDAKGRLGNEGSKTLDWTSSNQLKSSTDGGQTTYFYYDAAGNRALKRNPDGSATLYFRDAKGNPMAIYAIRNGQFYLEEMPIYAGKRIGSWRPDSLLSPDSARISYQIRWKSGLKSYELTDLTGNVRTLVSDRRCAVQTGSLVTNVADILQGQDYYAFGMKMPGRVFSANISRPSRYGFQGMEKGGDSYTTEFRQYDERVGRWLSVDKMESKWAVITPYNAMLDNPMMMTDQFGADPDDEQLTWENITTGCGGTEENPPVDMANDPIWGICMEETPSPARPRPRPRPARRAAPRPIEGPVTIIRAARVPDEVNFVEAEEALPQGTTVTDDGASITVRRPSRPPSAPEPLTVGEQVFNALAESTGMLGNVQDAAELAAEFVDVRTARYTAGLLETGTDIGGRLAAQGSTLRAVRNTLDLGADAARAAPIVGAVFSTVGMVNDIYNDANLLVDGDISTARYVFRSAYHVLNGAALIIPFDIINHAGDGLDEVIFGEMPER